MQQNKPTSYLTATGVIEYTLTSDLLFHYVMQQSPKALKSLVCALKGITPDTVKSIEVLNPIDIGSVGKETAMDLKLVLNTRETMNIELQMYTDKYWIPRSILYLCRAYDCLKEGDDYSVLKPTTHFCITNQKLFPDEPEFYSRYLLLNTNNYKPYTKNFSLCVLQLDYTAIATDDDISNNLVYWANLFNATTWEEFRELSGDDEAIEEVGNLIFTLNTDNQTREILEGQRRYREQMASQYTAGYTDAQDKYASKITEMESAIADKDALIKRYMDKYGKLDD